MPSPAEKLPSIPIALLHRSEPRLWELRPNPKRLPRVGEVGDPAPCFMARDVKVPLATFRGFTLPTGPPAPVERDARDLRMQFALLKTDDQFLDFLNKAGSFSPLAQAERNQGWQLNELIAWQKLFNELAARPPTTWSSYVNGLIGPLSDLPIQALSSLSLSFTHSIVFNWSTSSQKFWRGAKNIAVMETTNVVSSILATIELDHLRGAKFGSCYRHDCAQFFEITSRHKRKYCRQYCAHLASVRRLRKRAASKKTRGRAGNS